MINNDIRIVVLQRGWIAVGRFSQKGKDCSLDDASIIRRWGTTKGLGEIADGGPTSETVLDPSPRLEFHALTVVLTMACNSDKWSARLR